MGLIARLGNWLDRLFEPKVTQSQWLEFQKIYSTRMNNIELMLNQIPLLHEIVNKTMQDDLKLRDELTAIKALYKIGGTKPESHLTQKFDGSMPWKR
jgi:hypothetical protein